MRAQLFLGLLLTFGLTNSWADDYQDATSNQSDPVVQQYNNDNGEVDATPDTFDDSDFDIAPSE